MELFDAFIQERVYLKGVSPKTIIAYQCAFKAFSGATESKPAMMQRIMELREKGLNAISINSYLRHVKAYLRWMEQEGHLKDAFKVPRRTPENRPYVDTSNPANGGQPRTSY